eukprot:5506649-Amphidinium_carterae.1
MDWCQDCNLFPWSLHKFLLRFGAQSLASGITKVGMSNHPQPDRSCFPDSPSECDSPSRVAKTPAWERPPDPQAGVFATLASKTVVRDGVGGWAWVANVDMMMMQAAPHALAYKKHICKQ